MRPLQWSRSRAFASALAALVCAGCAASPVAKADPSPGSLVPNTTVGSHGSVFFVSAAIGWELTEPPDHLRTVVFRTADGGGHWQLWGIAPEPATPVGFTLSDVVLTNGSHLLRSSDGTHWSVQGTPGGGGTITFLPDLQHGWIYGFLPPSAAAPTAAPAGKGGVPAGKGGVPAGKGGVVPNGKGGLPTGIWSTTDGGSTWLLRWHSTFGDSSGIPSFWSPTDGMIARGLALLLTRDGGASWRSMTLSIPGVPGGVQPVDYAPTMFDSQHGVLPIEMSPNLYLSRTSDGGLTWSVPQAIQNCPPCSGQVMFLDEQHWVAYSDADYLSSDGGLSWRKVTTTNPGKTTSGAELIPGSAGTALVFAPGMFASETKDWGAHWKAVPLPDIYPSYAGFEGQGGWEPVPPVGSPAPLSI